MTISRRVAKNTSFLILDNIVSRLLGFVVNMLLFRRLGVAEFGVFSFAFSFPQLFLVVSDLGLEYYTIRETAAHREEAGSYIARIIPLKIIMFGTALALTFIALAFIGDRHARDAVIVYALYVFGRTFMTFFVAIIKGLEEMQYAALLSILESALATGFVVFLIKNGDSAVKVEAWYCIVLAAAMIPAVIIVTRLTGFPLPRIDFGFWKSTIAASWPFAVSILASLVHNNADIVMVMFFKGAAPVGLYKSCIIILTCVGVVQLPLSIAVFPVVSRLFGKEPGALEKTYEKAFKLLSMAGPPFYIGGAVLAKPLLVMVFGAKAAGAAGALAILSAAYLFINYGSFYPLFAAGINRQRYYIYVNIFVVALNIALNLFFIPLWGIKGASAATVISMGTLFLWIHFTIMRPYRKFPAAVFLLKLACALCAMAAAAYLARGFNVFIAVAAGGAVYAAALLILKPYSKDDLALLKKAILNRSVAEKQIK
jgi:O-antigen/teichoic acid export membrane protein